MNVQIKISMREELLERLEAALAKNPKSRTVNLIACEVIEDYLDLWLEDEEYRKKKVKRHYAKVRKLREDRDASKSADKSASKSAGKKASKK